ncbi:MAG: DVUA0089 family protein [Planctomycetota bacterium]
MLKFRTTAPSSRPLAIAIAFSTLAAAPAAFAGPDWDEGPVDAGNTLATAQIISTTGGINTITGRLNGTALTGGSDFQDCFLFNIDSPMSFNLTTSPGTGESGNFNPMMFLFKLDVRAGVWVAKAVMANNDLALGNPQAGLKGDTNDGSGTTISAPGVYLIAISGFGSQPINSAGEFIFNQAFLEPGIFAGPTGLPVANYELAGWSSDGSTGSYLMTVAGVSGTTVPAPGAMALLAMGGLAFRRRQR